jgi:hypothetical protein
MPATRSGDLPFVNWMEMLRSQYHRATRRQIVRSAPFQCELLARRGRNALSEGQIADSGRQAVIFTESVAAHILFIRAIPHGALLSDVYRLCGHFGAGADPAVISSAPP